MGWRGSSAPKLACADVYLTIDARTHGRTDAQVLDGENWWDQTPELWNWWNASLPGYDPGNVNNVEWYGMACSQSEYIYIVYSRVW